MEKKGIEIVEMTEADFVKLYSEFQAQQSEGEVVHESYEEFLEQEGYVLDKMGGWYEREKQ